TGVNALRFFREVELYNTTSLRPMLDFLPWLLLFLVPAVTMRALAEDARSGTLEVVLAQPITELELLLGKYCGQVLFLLIALAITLTVPLGLALGTAPELGIVVAQYVGAALLVAGLAAVGVWASSVTQNQITAFIVGVFVMFLLIFVGLDQLLVGLPPRLGAIAGALGVLSHFSQIARGVIDLRDAVYFVTLAALFLVLAYFALLSRQLTGRGEVKLVIQDPSADSAAQREARSSGIPPVQFNVLGQGELQVKEGYLGLAVRYADAVKTIPFIQQTNDLEYRLTSDIRALTHPERSKIAFGEISDAAAARGRRSFEELREQLGANHTVTTFALTDTTIAPDVKAIAVAGTPDSLNPAQLARLQAFLDRGGSLPVMAGGMTLSDQGPLAMSRRVGWNELLKPYGVSIASNMVYDLASNTQVGIPAQFGQVLIPYPFWLRAL